MVHFARNESRNVMIVLYAITDIAIIKISSIGNINKYPIRPTKIASNNSPINEENILLVMKYFPLNNFLNLDNARPLINQQNSVSC